MKTCRIPNTELVISRIAYGCAELVGKDKGPLAAERADKAARLINRAHDCGITFFDLADTYGLGKAEVAFGRVLCQSPGLRHRIVIQSKCGVPFNDDTVIGDAFRLDNGHAHIVNSVERSLQRLRTDYLDILLLHAPDVLNVPEEIAGAFDELQRSGKVRHFGVSNHTPREMDLLRRHVTQHIVINQAPLSLARARMMLGGLALVWRCARGYHDCSSLADLIDYCRLHSIQVQAYSPLRGDLMKPADDAAPSVKEAAGILSELAASKSSTTHAICLAWLLHHPAGIVPVIGTTSLAHIVSNCEATRITLTNEEWYALFIAAVKMESGSDTAS